MKKALGLFLTLWAAMGQAIPLDTFTVYTTNYPSEARKGPWAQLMARGSGTNSMYVLEVDPVTGAIPVSASFTSSDDHNYGVVGANTLRTAAQIGNSTGAAAFGNGAVSAQTLRTVSLLSDGTNLVGTGFGASANAVRSASILGNASGIADFGTGTRSAQTVRVTVATDDLVPVSGTITTNQGTSPWVVSGTVTANIGTSGSLATEATLSSLNGKVTDDFGASAAAVRTAAQVGNATGSADFGSGAAGAQTLRTVLSTRHESVATPLASQLSNGSSAVDYNSGAAGAATLRTVLATRHESVATPLAAQLSNGSSAIDYNSGAAGATTIRTVLATRHESATTPLSVRITDGTVFQPSATKSVSLKYRNDYTSTSVTTGAYVQVTASTSAVINKIWVFDSSGSAIILAIGAAASEVDLLYIPPGGFDTPIEVNIAAGTRLSLKALDTTASTGQIIINAVN